MSNTSKKHHYLPQFYLRGFTNEDGAFTIYDKKLKMFRKSKPEHEFYEKHRNTIEIRGEKSLIVEAMYSHLESILAPAIAKIEKSKYDEPIITDELVVRIKFFAETIRWRNPALDNLYESVVRYLTLKDFGLVINETNQITKDKIDREILEDPSIQKLLRPLMAAPSLLNLSANEKDINKWHILYQDGGFPIIGDFPVIFNPKSITDISNREFIMPLSSNRTVIHASIKSKKKLPDSFTINKDLAIIHLSRRYICCKHDDYLKFMVNYYHQNIQDMNDEFFEDIFNKL